MSEIIVLSCLTDHYDMKCKKGFTPQAQKRGNMPQFPINLLKLTNN
jgi:hypothetical protein